MATLFRVNLALPWHQGSVDNMDDGGGDALVVVEEPNSSAEVAGEIVHSLGSRGRVSLHNVIRRTGGLFGVR